MGTTPCDRPCPTRRTAGRRWAAGVADLHRLLIGVRRRHPWLAAATVEAPDVLSNELLAVRFTGEGHVLAAVLNVGEHPGEVTLPLVGGSVLAGDADAWTEAGGTRIRVAGHAYALVGAPPADAPGKSAE